MLLLTNVRRNGTVDLVIVLDDESIGRIRKYDPAEVSWHQLPPDYALRRPHVIGVAFATASEHKEIERLATDGKMAEAIALVSRGFKFHPVKGDHDFGPTVLGKPTPGVKQ